MKKTDIRQVFGRALEKAMEKRGINQQRLAELSGLSPGHISEARRGISAIGIDRLADLANALHVFPFELLIDEEVTREEIIRKILKGADENPGKVVAHSRRKKPRAGARH
jgi:transcriptional regulator with XRE-family HTH domain